MARGARRPAQYRKLTPYEWRVYSRTGMLPSEARARGISLAAARGHAPRAIEPGGERIPEHRLRDIRRRLRGEPTEAERNFLRRQSKRSGISYHDLRDRFMQYSQAKRDLTRQRQADAARRYKASKGRFKWTNDAPSSWGPSPGGRGGGGGGGGGGGPDFNEMTFDEFAGDWDDFPEYDAADDGLLFYH